MVKRQQTKGVCQLCQGVVSKAGMTRHLVKCLAAHEGAGAAVSKARPKPVRLFQLLAQGQYNPQYWLYVEMPATATLRDLDEFLRHIWLECCGHLSAFKIAGPSTPWRRLWKQAIPGSRPLGRSETWMCPSAKCCARA